MHEESGLWDELENRERRKETLSPRRFENVLLDRLYANGYYEHGSVGCGGSGVAHFDRYWLRHWMPDLEHLFTYWSYDIGAVRRFVQAGGWPTSADAVVKAHRAVPDTQQALGQARAFLSNLDYFRVYAGDPWL
jgi:oligoribonuclease (3'-5' exoribonuclease)